MGGWMDGVEAGTARGDDIFDQINELENDLARY